VEKPDVLQQQKTTRGFSLTELLVVVSIILILVTLVVVGVNMAYSQAFQTKCQHNLEQVGYALRLYALQNLGQLPEPRDMATGRLWYESLAGRCLDNLAVLGCPSVGAPPEILARDGYRPQNQSEIVAAYRKALNYLKECQETGGVYDGMIPKSSMQGFYNKSVPVSAMALMGYVGLHCNDRHPEEYADTVRRLVDFLCGPAMTSSGRFYAKLKQESWGRREYSGDESAVQGIGLMALAAAYESLEDPALRDKVRNAANKALVYLAGMTSSSGNYSYTTGVNSGTSRMSHQSWTYMAIGDCRRAGFNIPAEIDAAMANILDQNAQSNYGNYGGLGAMTKYWGASSTGTWSHGIVQMAWTFRGMPLSMRMSLGDTVGSAVVQNLINKTRTDLSEYRAGEQRYFMYHAARGLRYTDVAKWHNWRDVFPDQVLLRLKDAGFDDAGNPLAYWPSHQNLLRDTGGNVERHFDKTGVTAFSTMLLAVAFEENWMEEGYEVFGEGECSYGYNSLLAKTRGTIGPDTIQVMDYHNWIIYRGLPDASENDSDAEIQFRHGGQANALMGDGRVRALELSDIQPGMWTPQRGD
jgi:prepilin-type N-terminal cleavage/methylation domain-containing protein/prepilin-type processing-associated H-X9-DG protein